MTGFLYGQRSFADGVQLKTQRWGERAGLSRGPYVIPQVFRGGRSRQRSGEGAVTEAEARVQVMAEDGPAHHPGLQAASRSRKKQG